ncbi:aldehyde ferredoxin oxidoreductase family protein [Candidatus Aerophobetes bacterium]|nr:aldehyde ferredoxin oxidoreductase family protein [Candidatus Aerophobetes bacterium]
MKSYMGKILRVDLSSGKVIEEKTKEEWLNKYYGQKGLGIRYLLEDIEPNINPLSSENEVILIPGIFAGTIVSSAGKLAIASKSPATGTIDDGSVGGSMGAEIKYAGYDAIIIKGKAEHLVYLYITPDKTEVRDAKFLKGKGTHQTDFMLKKELKDQEIKIISIGPAGENLVKIACITSELYRQQGRGGIAAVMGSKNLKAVAVKGWKDVNAPDISSFVKTVYEINKKNILIPDNSWTVSDGTLIFGDLMNDGGILPTRNFQTGVSPIYKKLHLEIVDKRKKGNKACFGCALACGNYIKINNVTLEGPEYETLNMAGCNCGIADLKAITQFNKDCDDLGLDTISVGNIIAYAMEMREKGIHDFGFSFGDVENYLKLPERIAYRKGVGNELAEGVKFLSEKYGGKEFAMQVKGLEVPSYDPRGSWGMGLAYATSDRGACHMRAFPITEEVIEKTVEPFTFEGKAKLVIDGQHYNSIKFSVGVCDLWALDLDLLAKLLNMATESNVTGEDLTKGGERIWNLGRIFNVMAGFRRKDDILPERFFTEPLPEGPAKGKVLPKKEFEKTLLEYYHLRGWDEEGIPFKKKLKELEVDEGVIKKFERYLKKGN